jgi:protein-S-isoprenylcysteine O-methyltransferase Ste14
MMSSMDVMTDAIVAGALALDWVWLRTALLLGCWALFGVVWLVGALYNAYRAPAIRERGAWLSQWIVGIAIVVAARVFLPTSIWAALTFNALWLWLLGAVCLVLATAFTLWARGVLGTMWSGAPVARAGHKLRTSGPYAVTRHPIYTGLLGMLLGTMVLSGFGVFLLYFLTAVVLVELKIATEEKLLTATLGEQYRAYQRRVPQLIPGLQWLPWVRGMPQRPTPAA